MEKEQSMKFPYNFLFDIMENYNGKYNNLPNDILGTTMYIISRFNEREQEFVYGYYKEGKTYKQIGQKFGISIERVRQIRQNIIKRTNNDECQIFLSVGIENYIIHIMQEKIQSGKSLINNQIMLAKLTDVLEEIVGSANKDESKDIRRKMLIEELHLSSRSYNGLKRWGVVTVADILNLGDLYSVRYIGKKSVQEIIDKIQGLGLKIDNQKQYKEEVK